MTTTDKRNKGQSPLIFVTKLHILTYIWNYIIDNKYVCKKTQGCDP